MRRRSRVIALCFALALTMTASSAVAQDGIVLNNDIDRAALVAGTALPVPNVFQASHGTT